jgi:hypothetical protein
MDERYDMVRAVRDREFRYVRNYSPHRPWGQYYTYAFGVQGGMRSWFVEFEAGRCNAVQSAYWLPKPAEELYEVAADPFEITNLAAESGHQSRLAAMRRQLRAGILASRDTGFIPEGMLNRLAGEGTPYDYARSDAYPIERILDLADLATARDPAALPRLIAAMDDPHPAARYWAATGCLILQDRALPATEPLRALLDDDWNDVRVAAAEAIAWLGEVDAATNTLAAVLTEGNPYEVLAAQNAIEYLWRAGHVPLANAQRLVRGTGTVEPGNRIPKYLAGLPGAEEPSGRPDGQPPTRP